MIKYITEYLLGYSETPSGTTEIVLCFLCRWTKHALRSVFSAVFTIYLLRVWFPEQKDLQGISQQLMPSCRVSHLIIYAGCGQRAGRFFVTSLLSLCFWDALVPWRPNLLHVQCRSVPLIQGYSGISCWEKSSDRNVWLLPTAVILSHAEPSQDMQATSVLAN